MKQFYGIIILVFAAILFSNKNYAQQIESAYANKAFYRYSHSGGLFLHTHGYGGFYRKTWRKTGFLNYVFAVDLMTMKHPKEIKVSYQNAQQRRGFYYGKLNTVTFLRGEYGFQKMLYDKEVRRGVRVSYYFMGGPTIALLKPIFLEVDPNITDRSNVPITAQATSTIFNSDTTILSRSPMLEGIEKTKLRLGIHIKYALNFEYSGDDSMIRSLETGVTLDLFARRIPIMAQTYNDQFYLGYYIAFQFGKRYL